MGRLEDRLQRLERDAGSTVPWWTLPPGVEPDWPRPLKHLSDEALEVLNLRGIVRFCNASEIALAYRPSAEEVFEDSEAFHELRWRKYGIRRRAFTPPRPAGWTLPSEEDVHLYADTVEGLMVLELLEENEPKERIER